MIGREREKQELLRRYQRKKAEFIAIYGRRRVGKTFLIDKTFEGKITFRHAGLSPADDAKTGELPRQLKQFHFTMQRYGIKTEHCPASWMEAFFLLENWLEEIDDGSRQVVFLDELPWLDTPRSQFISALEGFWNNWGCHRDNLMLIVCGSACSWMADQLINNHGGLYNRLTCQIRLAPFNLKECELFFAENQVRLSRYDIAQGYMILGGIPYYLDCFEPGLSLAENIDRILFSRKALLKDEYESLFPAMFNNHAVIKAIVRFLAASRSGYTRNEIAGKLGFSSGGTLSQSLKSLVASDLAVRYVPFGRKMSEARYMLTDPFCLFWIHFMEEPHKPDEHYWTNNQNASRIVSWRGLAFENVCFQHIDQIKKALDIYGVQTSQSEWIGSDDELGGTQIDLLLDRADRVVNMCEIKYHGGLFSVNKGYYQVLSNRQMILAAKISPRKVIRHTLITTYGLARNEYSGIFSNVITLDDLFAC
jgi:AAA+ ATPase superfamily predicted ATPase